MVCDMMDCSREPITSFWNETTIGAWCFDVSGVPCIKSTQRTESESVCRQAARLLLAHTCGLGPEEITFTAGIFGKPKIGPGLFYSSSTDDSQAVIAIASQSDIGIDLQIKPVEVADLETLVGDSLANLPIENPRTLWARIEAVVKCRGIGFQRPVTALMLGQLNKPEGSLEVEGVRVWWRDLPHDYGSLCLAAEQPIERVVFHQVPWKLNAQQRPSE